MTVAAYSELSLVPALVLSIVPRTRAIDYFSSIRQQLTRALADQDAAPYLRHSGRLSVRHAQQ